MKRWGKRFLASTRGRVVEHLRRGEATAGDLADRLGVTTNAIRAHLATLERDGLVREVGKRPGVRKPETLYALTPEAEQLFPKAYHLVLNLLLNALGERLPPAEIEDLLAEVGRSIAAGQSPAWPGVPADRPPQGDLHARVEKSVYILNELGGLAEMHERNGGFVIQGRSCPLAAAVDTHPSVCRLAEALLAEITGAPVREECDRSGTPRCVFAIGDVTNPETPSA